MYLFYITQKIKLLEIKINYIFLIQLLLIGCYSNAQQAEKVNFTRVQAEITPIYSEKKISGTATYTFQILKECDSIFLDAVGIILLKTHSDKKISINSVNKKIWLISNFKPNKTYTVSFSYEAFPKQAIYFTGDQIWTQGQGKYTSNWLPSLDDMNDKIEFDLSILAPSDKTVIANGKLLSVIDKTSFKKWVYDMKNPMSSYLVAFAIGSFEREEITSTSGIPIELYYKSEDSLKVEPTYRYTKKIFDFLEQEIGVLYPWQNYKQVPVNDFLYAGMENTTATFFSEAFVVDSIGFKDRNYVNVNAHELAHQWFGNLITETEGAHHWLHEGFATYYARLTVRYIFGDDYYYWKLFQSAEQLTALSNEGKGELLNNPKASSLTFYEKGAWALHILNEKVGEKVFKTAIKNYLEKYLFKNVTTENFIAEVEKVYGKDLTEFKNEWFLQKDFKVEQVYESLMKSNFLHDFFELSALRETLLDNKKSQLNTALTFPDDFTGQEVVYQIEGEAISETLALYKKAFASNNVYIRQAIALSLTAVPLDLKIEYESLLSDDSYVTQEAALGNLWVSFPEDKFKYLDSMDGVQGFHDKNIRQFWLFLALITEEYKPGSRYQYVTELKQYTASNYGHSVREIALEYIGYLGIWDDDTLKNLIEACQHHYWRFRNSSRTILNGLIEDETYRDQLVLLGKELDATSSKFLNRMMQ